MTITPLAFSWTVTSGTAPNTVTTAYDIATDADLRVYHTQIDADRPDGQTNYRPQLEAAFNEAMSAIRAAGYDPALIDGGTGTNGLANKAAVKQLVIFKAFEIIFTGFIKESGDKWDVLSQKYAKDFSNASQAVKLAIDTDEDGTIDEEEEETTPYIRLVR